MHRWILLALTIPAAALAQTKPVPLRPIPDWRPNLGRAFYEMRQQKSANAPRPVFALPQGEVKCSVPLTEVPISKDRLFVMKTVKPKSRDARMAVKPPAPPCPELKK